VVFYVHKRTKSVINIVESKYPLAPATIFKFHSTFVMNYIMHDTLVSVYRNAFPLRFVRCMVKYALRGFTFLDHCYDWKKEEHDCRRYGYCGRALRLVGDEYTMRFHFIGGPGVEGDVIDKGLTWRLGCLYNCEDPKGHYGRRGGVMIRTIQQ
jgi:hypothetical protein